LLAALRTPGTCIVIEGASGVGKTTTVIKAVDELQLRPTWLTAKRILDQYLIAELPMWRNVGLVVIDDYQSLDACGRAVVSDYWETLKPEDGADATLVILRTSRAGEPLLEFVSDGGQQSEVLTLAANPDDLVLELIEKGENALNVRFAVKAGLVAAAGGDFRVAQMLCRQACLAAGITQHSSQTIEVPVEWIDDLIFDPQQSQQEHLQQIADHFDAKLPEARSQQRVAHR
jgi:ABC-type dipeptide/oligopeptide/nickel transport system ATPase subunit